MPAQHDDAAPPAAALTPTDEEFKIGEPGVTSSSPVRARLYHDGPTTPGGLEASYGKRPFDKPVGGRQRKDSKPNMGGRNTLTGYCVAKICGGLCCFTALLALGFVWFFWFFAYRPCPPMKGLQLVSAPKASMHNLLTDIAGVPDDQVDRKLGEAWEAIFRGVPKSRGCYQPSYFELDDGSAHVLNTESGYVTSEGMSYGMMIAAQMERQEEFDRLWRFTKKYMQRHDGPWKGMIAWKAGPDGEVMDANSAPDGDIYIAAALLIAHGHWGDAGYLYEARGILTALADPKTGVLTPDGKVVFAVYERERSNPSYHLPGFFEMFARVYKREGWAGEAVWAQAAAASRAFLKKATDPKTGLAPDFTNIDGTPWTLGDGNDNFQWDAWRVGGNIAFDWAWWGKDEWAREHADTLQAFFASKGLKAYTSLYTLDGDAVLDKRGARDHNAGLVAMNAVASLAARDRARASAFVKELWRTRLPTSGEWRYYPSMLYFLGLLHVSGRFKPVQGLQGLGHTQPPTAPAP